MTDLILHTGSNLGNRQANLSKANFLIDMHIGEITKSSAVYVTEPWGVKDQNDFLNQALKVQTELSPKQTLENIHKIEKVLGRIRGIKWQSRLIDIDLIFFGDQIIDEENLKVPHPHLHKRNFVMTPLNEIIPDFIHPVLNKTIGELSKVCEDNGEVKKQSV